MYENYLAPNDSNSALVAIEKVVTLDPGNASAIVEHAATLYRLGRFEEAKSAALKARSMPEKDDTWFRLCYRLTSSDAVTGASVPSGTPEKYVSSERFEVSSTTV